MTNQFHRQLQENCWQDKKIFPRTWNRTKLQTNTVSTGLRTSFVFVEKTDWRWFATNCLQTFCKPHTNYMNIVFVNVMFASVYTALYREIWGPLQPRPIGFKFYEGCFCINFELFKGWKLEFLNSTTLIHIHRLLKKFCDWSDVSRPHTLLTSGKKKMSSSLTCLPQHRMVNAIFAFLKEHYHDRNNITTLNVLFYWATERTIAPRVDF